MNERSNRSHNSLPRRFFSKTWGSIFLTLAMAFVVMSGIIAFPQIRAALASGTATITLSPSSASYSTGGSIAAQGSHFAASETVTIYWNYTGPSTGTLEATTTSDATGAFKTSFPVPLATTGTYTVAGVGQTNDVATTTFHLLPFFYIAPRGAGVASPLNLYGFAYGANETVNIYWNYTGPGTGSLMTAVTTDSTGSFKVIAPVPSGATPGHIPLAGVGQTSNTTASYPFILYTPTLALAPLSGSAGIALTLSAYGFQSRENVNIYWNGSKVPAGSLRATNQFGYMAPTTITVPANSAPGNYTVTAVGASTHLSITSTYSVVATVSSLSPISGPAASVVAVSGQGYAPNETVNILWNYTGPSTGTLVGSAKAGYSGTFNSTFTMPVAANGAYTVAAVGVTSNKVTQNTFTVGNGLELSATSTSPGVKVTAKGTGFTSGESVKLTWDSTTGATLGTAIADASGNISQSITIPTTAIPGTHQVISVGQTSSVSFTTSITLDTSWGDFGLYSVHRRQNFYEFKLGTTNVANLKLKWTSAPTATNLESSPVYANGLVYVTTSDGQLNAYNATTGTLQWNFNSNTGFENFSAPLVDPTTNTVFFGTIGHDFPGIPSPSYALDAKTGTLKWSVILPWDDFGFPTLALQTIYLGTSSEAQAGSLIAIDVVSGHVVWQDTTTGGVWGAAAVDTTAKILVSGLGNPYNAIRAYNPSTGATLWTYSVPNSTGDIDVGSGIDIANGLVYANSKNGSVYAVHESDGTLAWSTQIYTGIDDVSSPAYSPVGGTHGTVYAGTLGGRLYSLDASTGAINWNTNVGGAVWSSPAIANGVVYLSTGLNSGSFYALNASTGAILWSFTAVKSFSSPIVVNGWLYCNATNGKLYAFSL